MTTNRKQLHLPSIEPHRIAPWLELLDHAVMYAMCCVLMGVVLYLAIEQVR